jgi:hypothetical protein
VRGKATTKVSILRGTDTNEFEDEVDDNNVIPAASGVVAAIAERTRRVYLPSEGATRVVRTYSGQIGHEVDIRKGDRLRDENTSVVYLVEEISEPVNPANQPDYELQLSRTN